MNDNKNINPPLHVTERMDDTPVTHRMEEETVTIKMEVDEKSHTLNPVGIKKGELIDERYQIQEGPLGKFTGEADVYKCTDVFNGQTVALKLYRFNAVPKKDVMNQLSGLSHEYIISLLDYNVWNGHFYEVLEYCEGGSLDQFMPYTEEELATYLSKINEGINFCHNLGIIHRDIKPSNIFFRHKSKKGLVIGDFGISSIINIQEKIKKTETFKNKTLDYAAPELFRKEKLVGPKTDYYALGITLIHLQTGRSPFLGWDDESVIAAHLTEKIPLPEKMSQKTKHLIEGLTEKNIENRWGYTQVLQWIKGEVICNDNGSIWRPDPYIGKEIPYPGCQKAKNPRQLAKYLHEIDAEKDLFRGRISQWVHHFDSNLSDRIIELEENYTRNKELGVIKLRYLLDPSCPLMLLNTPIYKISELLKALQSTDKKILGELEKLLWNTHIECWIDATWPIDKKQEYLERIKSLRERLEESNKKKLGLFSLLYLLDSSVPLRFSTDAEITRIEELEDILVKHPEIELIARDFLFEGKFEEWLKVAYPDQVDDHQFVAQCRENYQNDQALGFYAFRWHFNHSVPFPFETKKVNDPKALASLINYNRTKGIELLKNGWIRTWLAATGNWANVNTLDKHINPNFSWGRKLEEILHILDPNLPWPKLACSKTTIHSGKIPYDSKKDIPLKIHNAGPGYLAGTISLEPSGLGVSADKTIIEGDPINLKLTITPGGLPVGSHQKTNLVINTNGGTLQIPISYAVSAPIMKMLGRSVLFGIILGIVFGTFRLVVNTINIEYSTYIMDWLRFKDPAGKPMFILLGIILIIGLIFYLKRVKDVQK